MIHLVQLSHPQAGRRAALVEEGRLLLLRSASVYDLVRQALSRNTSLEEETLGQKTEETVDYEAVYQSRSEWSLPPPLDHPTEPARCLVSGTGLTHSKGAANRDAMHQTPSAQAPKLTDSMQIY